MPNFRDLAVVTSKSVFLDEDLLDIYDYDTTPIPDWEPSVKIKPFDEATKVYLDIETTGLNKNVDSIVLIGLMNERGISHIIDCKTDGEYSGLLQFIQILNRKKPEILATFNGFDFDLPFIIHKLDHYRIAHNFYINRDKLKVFKTAQYFSKPTEYYDIWLNRGQTTIIDLYHQALAWDFVAHKLTRYRLKDIPNQLSLKGYEDSNPIELSYQEMLEAISNWTDGGKEKLCEYLQSDLKATKAIGDFLIPNIWYQQELLPKWKLQSIATSGNGSKWNDILKEYYLELGFSVPEASKKLSIVGGLTASKAGLYRNISKIDVESLYPTVMLLYGICSDKDPYKFMLSVLKYLKMSRIKLKKLAKQLGDTPEGRDADQSQGSKKVQINSSYGFLGTAFIEFNDMVAAAAVTGYGRAILKKMMSSLEECGVVCASADTDGVYYSSESHEKNKQAWQYCQAQMPDTVNLEYELEALAMYNPPSADADSDEGLRKNYILIVRDKKGEIKVKCKGRYVKRNASILEKTFIPELVKRYLEGSHEAYYKKILCDLMVGVYPTENLSVTRKISSKEKKIVEQGIGNCGDVVTIWKAPDKILYGKRGQPLKNAQPQWTKDPAHIDRAYYIQMVKEMWEEFSNCPKF